MNEDEAITHGLRWLYQRSPVRGAIDVTAAREPFGSWVVELRAASLPDALRIRIYPSGVTRLLEGGLPVAGQADPPADDPAAGADE